MKSIITRLALLLLVALPSLAQVTTTSALCFNEVQVANIDQFLDNAYCYGSWIELYNSSDNDISLGGMYLVEGENESRFLSSATKVPAHGYKVLWFDHSRTQGNYGPNSAQQVPFKLNADGGEIQLQASDRSVVTSVQYPPSIARCSWARTTDGGDEWEWTGDATPGSTNNESHFAQFRLEAPTTDTPSRLFSEPFTVRVSIPSGYTLRYTTDGSAPTKTHGETSRNGRFDIDQTTILRLCFVRDGYLPSPVATRSYIFRNHDYYLPVLSVVSEPRNFFDDEIGVFVKGTNGISGNGQKDACNWNMDWERPVNMEYLVPQTDADGKADYSVVLNQEVDLEICGGWTRAYGNGWVDDIYWPARSSFRLKTDRRYEGVHEISYPVFPSKPYNKYRSWQVRNGGNDTYSRTKDPAIQQMVLRSGFYVDCQDYQPAHVFLNGEYFGMLNIRESNNKHFAYSNYGIDFEDMDQFDLSNAQYNQKMGDNKAWMQLQSLSKRLASSKSAAVYSQICDLLDIDEYVNYMALECYMGPSDWITNTNNIKAFRSRTDGKFHFVLFDADSAFGSADMLTAVLNTSGGANVDDLFRNLMAYDPFRRQFMDAFCIVNGSVFEPTRCEDIMREIYNNVNPALAFEDGSTSMSLAYTIRSAYNGTRISNLRSYFNPPFNIYATLSANIPEARLAVNGQEIPTGLFSGYLYSYKGQPIQLTAKSPAGYSFGGWDMVSEETVTKTLIAFGSEWMYFDRGSMDRFDWKSIAFNETESNWKAGTAPFGFAKEGYFMQENSVTKLNTGTDTKRPTYYFRHTFRIDAPLSDADVLTFNYQVDDGIMLYVNGHEVGGYYIASGSTYSDYTIDQHFEGQEPYQGSFIIPHEYLVVGDNQIALEVKNCHGTSSDMWFDGSLTFTGKERQIVAQTDAVDLKEVFTSGSRIALEANFVRIAEESQRWDVGASPLRINEVCATGDICINDYGKKADWVELYNTTGEDIPLAGIYLSDNPGNPQKYQLQQGIVPAHGTCIVWCDKKDAISQLHAPFKLENADGAMLCIQAADGSWSDCLEYKQTNKWQTYGRYPDGGNTVCILNQPTIDKSNRLGKSDFDIITSLEAWNEPDGITDIAEEQTEDDSPWPIDDERLTKVKAILYYNLSGQRIAQPESGICIRQIIYQDGSTKVAKMSLK